MYIHIILHAINYTQIRNELLYLSVLFGTPPCGVYIECCALIIAQSCLRTINSQSL